MESPRQLLRLVKLGGALALILIIGLVLRFQASTPRSRLNVVEGAAVVFFVGVVLASFKRALPEAHPTSGPSSWVAIAFAVVTWASVIPCYFISDDFAILRQAQHLTRGTLWGFLTRSQVTEFFRPVGQASLLLDFNLWGMRPAGYHFVNLVVHLISLAGIFSLFESFRLNRAAGATAALIFGVLPIQIEAIAWMVGRFDLLATCFTIWTVVLYSRFRHSGRRVEYLGALLLFTLAMLSKESGYTLPLLLLSAELFIYPTRRLKPWLVFVFVGGFVFVFRWVHLGGIGGYMGPHGERSALTIHFKTLEGLFLRGPSQVVFGFNWLQPSGSGFIALCSLLAGTLVMLAVYARPSSADQGVIRFAISWMLASMAPAHFLLMIGPGLTNSRTLYMPSVGGAMIIGTLLAGVKPVRFRQATVGLVAALFSLAVLHNSEAWRRTSNLSQEFLSRVKQLEPAPPPNTELSFGHMPETVRGIFFFRVGLQDAFNLVYQRDDITARRDETTPVEGSTAGGAPRPIVRFEWDSVSELPVLLSETFPRTEKRELLPTH